ncbi:hypothetical protein AB0F91_39775 [Amycolatopsis sp. NPDC023774]|uniref:hypothetical protein n=1 Tax=Amycolatopsis sp. NPDC023774 TaxID=3155015 RepID=UPI0033FCEBC2
MRKKRPVQHDGGVVPRVLCTAAAAGVLGLVVWLPVDRATAVASLVGSVVAGVAPAWFDRTKPRDEDRD